uniref:Hydroxysteroid (17-beta) dehydrogenase 3 n=1 Tax=Salarias fasciatus TaxID=181472 RepID=A0A672GCM9_SALFA
MGGGGYADLGYRAPTVEDGNRRTARQAVGAFIFLKSSSCVLVSVVTGASEGIGRAYAFALAERGMNVVIMSRTRERLDLVAKEIGEATDQTVKVITTDFINENVFSEIEDQLKDLDIGILVNNVGVLPGVVPSRYLECENLDQVHDNFFVLKIKYKVVQLFDATLKVGPWLHFGFVSLSHRGKGLIVNISSGIATVPFPYYSLYAASKIFVERVSQGLQAEYKDKGIIIQAVAPFGVSTRMVSYQKTNIVTLSAENFVKSSLQYIRAGDRTNGSICHSILGWILQHIPLKIFYAECVLHSLQSYIKNQLKKSQPPKSSRSTAALENQTYL